MKKPVLLIIAFTLSAVLTGCGEQKPTAKDVADIINSNVDTDHCLSVSVQKNFLIKNKDGSYEMSFYWTAHRAGNDYNASQCSLYGFTGHFYSPMFAYTHMQPGAKYGPVKASVKLQRTEDGGWVGSFDW